MLVAHGYGSKREASCLQGPNKNSDCPVPVKIRFQKLDSRVAILKVDVIFLHMSVLRLMRISKPEFKKLQHIQLIPNVTCQNETHIHTSK